MQILLIVGNDSYGFRAGAIAAPYGNIITAVDTSSSFRRVFRLICKGSLSPLLLFKMAWAELLRPRICFTPQHRIRANDTVLKLVNNKKIDKVLLFRAGLIVNSKVLGAVEVENIHCASLPGFGGIGSIARALAAQNYSQTATHHKVTTAIDSGEILNTEKYVLDPAASYATNENIAYEAGLALLEKILETLASKKHE